MLFLPPFRSYDISSSSSIHDTVNEFESYDGMFRKRTFIPLMVGLGLSLAIVAASYGLSFIFREDIRTSAIILLITTFGIGLSFIPKVNQIEKSFQLGMYFILIFCIVIASMADIRQLVNISFSLFWYVALAMFGSHILHAFIARLFRIDADTVIISGSALICAPPFVPVVAGALRNREVILTGLFVGIAGYALGNYLCVFVAYMLK
ncbi:MAG: DUF819 family protein [Bacteroidales bacterium]|nr:MAG: DUF819 family protein [Bacteroidales bacterium]